MVQVHAYIPREKTDWLVTECDEGPGRLQAWEQYHLVGGGSQEKLLGTA